MLRQNASADIALSPEKALLALGVPAAIVGGIMAHAALCDIKGGTVLARVGPGGR